MTHPDAHSPASPWHEGELALQRHVGAEARLDGIGRRFLRDHMPEQHREFYPLLPCIVLGAVAPDGQAWATMRAGEPGFMQAPDPFSLRVRAARDAADPAEAGMENGDAVGLLGIDLATRRRNRLNGTLRRDGEPGFVVEVGQTFGNCPRYIQQRNYAYTRDPALPSAEPARELEGLDDAARRIVTAADTFFVASYAQKDGRRQVDVSHRGGKAGFVHVDEDGRLTIPDYAGNMFFNTLGNILLNGRAGLLFVDFATGDVLQLSGEAEVRLDAPEIFDFEGAERLWVFRPRRTVLRPAALPLRWLDIVSTN